jgi:hypothetical protein
VNQGLHHTLPPKERSERVLITKHLTIVLATADVSDTTAICMFPPLKYEQFHAYQQKVALSPDQCRHLSLEIEDYSFCINRGRWRRYSYST